MILWKEVFICFIAFIIPVSLAFWKMHSLEKSRKCAGATGKSIPKSKHF
jgi:hypothetical protein